MSYFLIVRLKTGFFLNAYAKSASFNKYPPLKNKKKTLRIYNI